MVISQQQKLTFLKFVFHVRVAIAIIISKRVFFIVIPHTNRKWYSSIITNNQLYYWPFNTIFYWAIYSWTISYSSHTSRYCQPIKLMTTLSNQWQIQLTFFVWCRCCSFFLSEAIPYPQVTNMLWFLKMLLNTLYFRLAMSTDLQISQIHFDW